jgi:hypothetical protein
MAMRQQRPAEYYLLELDDFRRNLMAALEGRVSSIVGLSALDPTPTFGKSAVVRSVEHAVVLERGKPVGVVDAAPAARDQPRRLPRDACRAAGGGGATAAAHAGRRDAAVVKVGTEARLTSR